MIGRQELYDRQCVASLIHVIEQVPLRAAVRGPLGIDRASVGLLLLWSVLRWERTFLIQTLERMGVDLWSLTREVDEAIKLCNKRAGEAGTGTGSDDLTPLLRGWLNQAVAEARKAGYGTDSDDLDLPVRRWLDQAAAQARALRHDFLSGEHLLLAMLAEGDCEFAAIFQGQGLTYDALKQAVVEAISGTPSTQVIRLDNNAPGRAEPVASAPGAVEADPSPTKPEASSWIADIDRPAVGVPRRFGVFLMMLMVTLYAFLFSLLRLLRANDLVFTLLALLFTGIGIGQAVLFGGRYPRSASIWIGAILVPIEVCVFVMWKNDYLYLGSMTGFKSFEALLLTFLLSVPPGAIFGYLFGTVTAGGFWLVDWYEKRHPVKKESPAD